MILKLSTVSWIRIPWTYVTSSWSMTNWWRYIISTRTKTSPCHPTSTSLWPVSPPVGPGSDSMQPFNCWGNVSCTTTRIPLSSCKTRGNLTRSWAITSATSRVNWTPTTTLRNSCRLVPRTMATKPNLVTSSARCGVSASTAKANRNWITTSCDRTSSTKSRSHSRNHAKHKSSKRIKSYVIQYTTKYSPFLITNVTNWCTTRESWTPAPSSPIPMATSDRRGSSRDSFPKSTPSRRYCVPLLTVAYLFLRAYLMGLEHRTIWWLLVT